MVETGITSDNFSVVEDSGGTENITNKFGLLLTASHTVTQPVTQKTSIGKQPKMQANIDGVTEIQGGITSNPSSLEVLEVFGTYSESDTDSDGVNDQYSITPDDTLPTYTVKQQKVGSGGTVTLSKFKFGSFQLSMSEGEEIELSTSGMARDFKADSSESVTTESPDTDVRNFFDGKVKLGGTVVGSVDSATVSFDRNLEPHKGIEDDAAGSKRVPTQIIEKLFTINADIVINIEDLRAYEEALDDSTSPVNVQDDRSDTTVEIVVDTAAGTDTLKLTGYRPEEVTAEMNDDAEKRTATVTGVARDWSVTGDL